MRVVLLLAGLASPLAAQAPPAAESDARPRLEAVRLSRPPVVDGNLDDEAWQGPALALGDWLTYNPLNGERMLQTTEVHAAYDDRFLYFAFRCRDPEPDKVRSTLSRRDSLFNDDWVGLSLDSVGNSQSSYDMFVNPAGVQADVLTTPSAGENSAPDWVWDSAGRRTAEGYDVEVRLPLSSIRFKSGARVDMGVLFWRRVSRLGMSASSPAVPAGKSFIDSHAILVLHDVKRPLTLEAVPSLTYSLQESRTSPSAFGPADSDPDAGLTVKYGLTSATSLEATVNPDFSQVESDAFQVAVNNRFPIFYSEKRPFFMEGMGTFELAGAGGDANMRTAVHTRKIEDPLWGGKATGTAGRLAFSLLAAGDDAPGQQTEGEPPNPYLGLREQFYVARGQWSLGRSSYLGGLVTDTEFASGHNRVAAADVSLKLGNHATSGTFLTSATRSPEGDGTHGRAGQAFYAYETKAFVLATQVEHYDRGFQMDTAFLNQTGVTQGWSFLARSFYPDPKKRPWLMRIVPFVFSRYGKDRVQGGNLYFVLPGFRMHLTRQGFFRFDLGGGREPWAGQVFDTRTLRLMGGAQLFRWLNLFAQARFGRSIYYDPEAPFLGRQRVLTADLSLQPSSRFNQSVSYYREVFDRADDGSRVYSVDVVNTRTSFQIDKRFALRAIVQYDSSEHRVLTDFLASYELVPGTVAYAGYGSLIERQAWDGAAFTEGPGARYRTTERSFFFKASYSHRF